MAKKLHKELLELREKVDSVKRSWFSLRGRQILNSLYPEIVFKFSDHWFGGFSWSKRVSIRKKMDWSNTSRFETFNPVIPS